MNVRLQGVDFHQLHDKVRRSKQTDQAGDVQPAASQDVLSRADVQASEQTFRSTGLQLLAEVSAPTTITGCHDKSSQHTRMQTPSACWAHDRQRSASSRSHLVTCTWLSLRCGRGRQQ